jgi:hypothetical protein
MGKTYPNEIDRILRMPGGDVGKAGRKLALEIAEESRRSAVLTYGRHPMDQPRTGEMAKAYRVEVVPGTNHFLVRNPKKYAAAMELGAKPHIIRARRRQTLQFRDRQGRWRRVQFVNHPGSVARNTMWTATRVVMVRRFGTAGPS